MMNEYMYLIVGPGTTNGFDLIDFSDFYTVRKLIFMHLIQ